MVIKGFALCHLNMLEEHSYLSGGTGTGGFVSMETDNMQAHFMDAR